MKQVSVPDQVIHLPVPEILEAAHLKKDTILHVLPAAVYMCDRNGLVTLYNRAAAELWGREPGIGKEYWTGAFKMTRADGSPLPPELCPMAVCLKEQRVVTGEEIIVARPDGTLRSVVPHPRPLFDESGKLVGAVNMLVDITDFKNAEAALRESEAKYRELAASLEKKIEQKTLDLQVKNEELKKSEERYHKMVEEVEDYAIILLDKDGIIRNWNKGAEKIKGYREDEIIGKSFEIFYRPEDRATNLPRKLISEAANRGKATHEGWRVRKNGALFWGSIVLTALHGSSGEIIGFTKVTRDLTAKKLSEDKMKEYTSQLEFQNNELEQFAYAASHDMKEPLRKIHLYNSSVLENPANRFDEKSREYLNRSVAATRRMNNLIEDLLTYSRTTASREVFEKVDLGEIVDEIVLLHREELEPEKATIEFNSLPVLIGIPFQLKQLINNLVSNSLKYRHPDRPARVQITAELESSDEIPEAPQSPTCKEYHKISVIDNGIGFDQQHAEKMFDIFQRLNNLPGAQGSGIGLAICKKIAQNHKGFIRATGIPGEGARFDIYIPVKPD